MHTANSLSTFFSRLGLLAVLGLSAAPAQAQTQPTWASVQRSSSTGMDSGANGDRIAVAADGSQYITGTYYGNLTLGAFTLTGANGVSNLFVAKISPAGAVLWLNKIEATTNGDLFSNIAVDAQGNAYVTGYFNQSLILGGTTLNSPGDDSFLVKYDAQGTQQWVRQGGSQDTYATAIATDASGNVRVVGDFYSSVSFGGTPLTGSGLFLYQLSPAGTVLQANLIGSGGLANDIAIDAAGNTYVTGGFDSSVSFGSTTLSSAGEDDVFLSKVDAQGAPVWALRTGGADYDAARAVAVDPAGNPLIGGVYDNVSTPGTETSSLYLARFSAQGTPLWSRLVTPTVDDFYSVNDIAYDGRGGFLVTGGFQGTATFGSTVLSTAGQEGLFVARYNGQGTAVWAATPTHATAGDASIGFGIAADGNGNGYVTGAVLGDAQFGPVASTGGLGLFVAKLNAGGILATRRTAEGLALQAYPNPAAGSTALNLPGGGGHLVLTDALGRTVREQALPTAAGPCPVSLAGLAPGLYQLRAALTNGQVASAQVQVR